jgi:hypothetical protein
MAPPDGFHVRLGSRQGSPGAINRRQLLVQPELNAFRDSVISGRNKPTVYLIDYANPPVKQETINPLVQIVG